MSETYTNVPQPISEASDALSYVSVRRTPEAAPDRHEMARAIVGRNMGRILAMSFAEPQLPLPSAPGPSQQQPFARQDAENMRATSIDPEEDNSRPVQPGAIGGTAQFRTPRSRRRELTNFPPSGRAHKRRLAGFGAENHYETMPQEDVGPDPSPEAMETGVAVEEEGGPPTIDDPEAREIATGILGELFMYKVLKDKLRLPEFDVNNWASSRRGQVPGFEVFEGISVADFVYQDSEGSMTRYLFGDGRRHDWEGRWPAYHIEVKSTVGTLSVPFLMRQGQLRHASAMTHRDEAAIPQDLYVLARVWYVQSDRNIQFQLFVDPHKMLYDGKVEITSDVEVAIVTP
ncbi:hypothetical protein NM688_g2984 [Phlebia brevispora]|uniref:Uncharacterized protein n=1 Tax=Phlebia brevispora TaxID=194682 RepID=A0ACC1T786_9APHY|nr:hypothetical protein NM688_g2984 [Phlebia brevispora]